MIVHVFRILRATYDATADDDAPPDQAAMERCSRP
jgi:hypothetical protein